MTHKIQRRDEFGELLDEQTVAPDAEIEIVEPDTASAYPLRGAE